MQVGVALSRPAPLRALAAADAELVDAPVADDVPDAPQYGRVGEAGVEVFLAQVGVRVEVDDGEVRVFLVRGAQRGQRHEVLAADEEGEAAGSEDVPRARLDISERLLRVAEGELEVAAVEDRRVLKVEILIGAVRLESVGFGAHRAAREARTGAVARRRVERRAEEHDAALLEGAVAAEKGFYITVPHRAASPLHSLAGRRRPRAAGCYSSAS